MNLKHQIESYYTVDYTDLEKLVEETYEHPYSFVTDIECHNDSEHDMVCKKKPLNEFHQLRVNKFKATGKYNWTFYSLMQDMVNNDIIDEGNYLIRVFGRKVP
jgi:hypothetical protein